jgi:carbonic anhydrase
VHRLCFSSIDPICPDMHFPAQRISRVGFVVFMGLWGTAGVRAAAGAGAEAAFERLRAGNDRFVRALMTDGGSRTPRRPAVDAPSAVVVSCADPGAAPEQIFDSVPGDLVSVRVAGPVADRVVVASVEDAVERLKASVLVVMGHDTCATVRRVSSGPARPRGSDVIADALAPGLARAASRAELDARLAATQAVVEVTVNDLLRASERLRQRVKSGDLLVAGAYYEAETGRVVFSRRVDRVPAGATPVHGTR